MNLETHRKQMVVAGAAPAARLLGWEACLSFALPSLSFFAVLTFSLTKCLVLHLRIFRCDLENKVSFAPGLLGLGRFEYFNGFFPQKSDDSK